MTKGIFQQESSQSRRPGNIWEISPEAKKTPYFTTYRRAPLSSEEIEAINNGGVIVGDYKKVKPIKLTPGGH